jgi:hypothetical protein
VPHLGHCGSTVVRGCGTAQAANEVSAVEATSRFSFLAAAALKLRVRGKGKAGNMQYCEKHLEHTT